MLNILVFRFKTAYGDSFLFQRKLITNIYESDRKSAVQEKYVLLIIILCQLFWGQLLLLNVNQYLFTLCYSY